METIVLPILVAATVASATFGLAHLVTFGAQDRRRLKQRLTSETQIEAAVALKRSVVLADEQDFGGIKALAGLSRRISVAYPGMPVERFLGRCLGLALVMAIVIGGPSGSAVVVAVAALFGFCLPFFFLTAALGKRQRAMEQQLPEALDFLSRILRAGHSFSTGLQMMGEELPPPLAAEFNRCYQQHNLGAAMEDCLREMAARIDSTDFSFFVTAVLIQRQTGGDLTQVLGNISGMIRQRIRLQANVKSKTAEGRLTGYVLVAFPLVMFLLTNAINPAYGQEMLNTATGLKMLATAAGLMILGLVAIRKITTIRV